MTGPAFDAPRRPSVTVADRLALLLYPRERFDRDDDRWSPRHATKAEERLSRRLGRGTPGTVAADPGVYAAWRSTLVEAGLHRLFENFALFPQRGLGQGAFAWRSLSVGERRLLFAGFMEHLFQRLRGKAAQQFAQQGAVSQGLGRSDGADVASVQHDLLSCGLQPGDEAESGAGVSPSPAKDDALFDDYRVWFGGEAQP